MAIFKHLLIGDHASFNRQILPSGSKSSGHLQTVFNLKVNHSLTFESSTIVFTSTITFSYNYLQCQISICSFIIKLQYNHVLTL